MKQPLVEAAVPAELVEPPERVPARLHAGEGRGARAGAGAGAQRAREAALGRRARDLAARVALDERGERVGDARARRRLRRAELGQCRHRIRRRRRALGVQLAPRGIACHWPRARARIYRRDPPRFSGPVRFRLK